SVRSRVATIGQPGKLSDRRPDPSGVAGTAPSGLGVTRPGGASAIAGRAATGRGGAVTPGFAGDSGLEPGRELARSSATASAGPILLAGGLAGPTQWPGTVPVCLAKRRLELATVGDRRPGSSATTAVAVEGRYQSSSRESLVGGGCGTALGRQTGTCPGAAQQYLGFGRGAGDSGSGHLWPRLGG